MGINGNGSNLFRQLRIPSCAKRRNVTITHHGVSLFSGAFGATSANIQDGSIRSRSHEFPKDANGTRRRCGTIGRCCAQLGRVDEAKGFEGMHIMQK
jgi:hypothetical protein